MFSIFELSNTPNIYENKTTADNFGFATACVISSPAQDLLNKLKKKAGQEVIKQTGWQTK